MAYQGPRLRGGRTSSTPYPLGQIPDSIILSIASNIVYSSAVGRQDISGDERNIALLEESGWKVVTVWECQITDIEAVAGRLVDFLG